MNSKFVLFSACLYSVSFLFMECFFWLMVPASLLLLAACVSARSAWQGLLWGLIVYGVQSGVLIYGLYLIRPSWILVVGWLGITLYLAAFMAAVFFVSSHSFKFIPSVFIKVILSVFLLGGCFYCVDRYSLFVFGVEGGYCLANPLLPLVYGVESYCTKNNNEFELAWRKHIAVVRTDYVPCAEVDSREMMRDFLGECATRLAHNSSITLFVTPESAFPFVLNKNRAVFAGFSDNSHALCGTHFFVGSFYKEKKYEESNQIRNGFYWFADGVCKKFYSKQHAMPFVEMVPGWCNFSVVQALFLSEASCSCVHDYGQTDYIREPCELVPGIFFHPLICSEVFCTDMLAHVPPGVVALVLVNDAWFAHPMLWQVARLYVVMQAWWYGVSVLYVSYRYDFFKYGL
jgi:hypothetical protein